MLEMILSVERARLAKPVHNVNHGGAGLTELAELRMEKWCMAEIRVSCIEAGILWPCRHRILASGQQRLE